MCLSPSTYFGMASPLLQSFCFKVRNVYRYIMEHVLLMSQLGQLQKFKTYVLLNPRVEGLGRRLGTGLAASRGLTI